MQPHLQIREAVVKEISEQTGVEGCSLMKLLLPFVKTLDLANKGITELQAGGFSGFSSLEILDLSRSQISVLPEEIFSGLSSLRYLYLRGAQLPREELENIRAAFPSAAVPF